MDMFLGSINYRLPAGIEYTKATDLLRNVPVKTSLLAGFVPVVDYPEISLGENSSYAVRLELIKAIFYDPEKPLVGMSIDESGRTLDELFQFATPKDAGEYVGSLNQALQHLDMKGQFTVKEWPGEVGDNFDLISNMFEIGPVLRKFEKIQTFKFPQEVSTDNTELFSNVIVKEEFAVECNLCLGRDAVIEMDNQENRRRIIPFKILKDAFIEYRGNIKAQAAQKSEKEGDQKNSERQKVQINAQKDI